MAKNICRKFKGTPSEYTILHNWIRLHRGKPKKCENCGTTNEARVYQWANLSGEYKKDLNDWKRLCAQCHSRMDRKSDYWSDEYCRHNHRLTLDNLYLKHDKQLYSGVCIECKKCKLLTRILSRRKQGISYKADPARYTLLIAGDRGKL